MSNKKSGMKIREMDLVKKLEIIEKIEELEFSSEYALGILEMLSKDIEEEIKIKVAQALVLFECQKAEDILISIMLDESELVRINTCDSLCISNSETVIELLKKRVVEDKCGLVRSYAALSIVDVALKTNYCKHKLVEFFEEISDKEKTKSIKIYYYNSLYRLGVKKYLLVLIGEINNRIYTNRCAVINLLTDLLTEGLLVPKDIQKVKEAILKRLEKEKSIAVKSTINDVLNIFSLADKSLET